MRITYLKYSRSYHHVLAWSVIFLWLLLGISCTSEEDQDFREVNKEEVVALNLSTRSLGTKDSLVNSIRIIVAKQDLVGTIITNEFVPDPVNDPITIKTKSGLYDVFVITNEANDLGASLDILRDAKTIEEVKNAVIPFNLNQRPETNIPMIGEVRDVRIVAPTVGGPSETNPANVIVAGVNKGNILPVSVTRLAVKIDLVLLSKSFGLFESATITNIPDGVYLFESPYEEGNKQSIALSKDDFENQTKPLDGYIWEQHKLNIVLPSVLFAPKTEAIKAVQLEVKAGGKTMYTPIGHIIETTLSNKDYTLHRNVHYTFTGRISGDKLVINAAIADWLPFSQDFPTGGGKWALHPVAQRIGINTSEGGKAEFTAKFLSTAPVSYQWMRRYQIYNPTLNKIETRIDPFTDMTTDTLIVAGAYTDKLSITTKKIDVSGEIYCIATTLSPDGTAERSESERVTFIAVGENYQWPENSFPSMQDFKAPSNAPLGSTCILQDARENYANVFNVYHVKLMSDGNWWMIQDLAFGGTVDSWDKSESVILENVIAPNTYGIAMKTGLPTGGHYYNTYAAVQLTSTTKEEYDTNKGVKKEYLQSVCPDGWHVPGNYNGRFNQEWLDFDIRNGVDYLSVSDFTYNLPTAFNAYTENTNRRFYFAGGCSTVRPGGSAGLYYYFRSQGAILGDFPNISIGSSVDETVQTTDKVMIRCVKNFK